jgi:hypothetical protein
VGYFAIQRLGESLTGKSSNPLRHGAHPLRLVGRIAALKHVNRSSPTIDGKQYEVLSWYRLPSGNTTGRYETKLRMFLDGALHRHNNGAVILVAGLAGQQDGLEPVVPLLEFAETLAPVLDRYLQ